MITSRRQLRHGDARFGCDADRPDGGWKLVIANVFAVSVAQLPRPVSAPTLHRTASNQHALVRASSVERQDPGRQRLSTRFTTVSGFAALAALGAVSGFAALAALSGFAALAWWVAVSGFAALAWWVAVSGFAALAWWVALSGFAALAALGAGALSASRARLVEALGAMAAGGIATSTSRWRGASGPYVAACSARALAASAGMIVVAAVYALHQR